MKIEPQCNLPITSQFVTWYYIKTVCKYISQDIIWRNFGKDRTKNVFLLHLTTKKEFDKSKTKTEIIEKIAEIK